MRSATPCLVLIPLVIPSVTTGVGAREGPRQRVTTPIPDKALSQLPESLFADEPYRSTDRLSFGYLDSDGFCAPPGFGYGN